MKVLFSLFVLLLTLCPVAAQDTVDQSAAVLMPLPAEMQVTGVRMMLSDSLTIGLSGNFDQRLLSGATRALRRLSSRTGLFFPQHYLTKANNPGDSAAIQISVERPGKVELSEDESYQLTITPANVFLSAATGIGALRGLETLLQLLQAGHSGYYFPAVVIKDKPRFPWRGLLIDVSRHFMPLDVLKRNLDAMAAVKLNVLHLHLADDQGFRVESRSYPDLHLKASDGFYYTQRQIGEILSYAANRGIRVVPEFDVPAHATSWLTAYPQLGSAPGPYTLERGWGIKDPVMDPSNPDVYKFLDRFFEEMAALFPDQYMHIGGDENNGKHWAASEKIQKFMKKENIADEHALHTYFNQRISKILQKHKKRMVGWDEIFQPGLPQDAVVHSWRGHKALNAAAKAGYQTILSNGYYIDLVHDAARHYRNDPIPEDSKLTPEEQKYVLGGEATMWAELVSPETVDSRIWPRTAAIAERFWSPRDKTQDVEDMYRRLDRISFLLEEHGLLHRKNYEMFLRRLTNDQPVGALDILISAIEPVENYTRHSQGVHYTATSPLTRVVDAAPPESMRARAFRQAVDSLLNNPVEARQVMVADQLLLWKQNHSRFVEILPQSPILREVESLSADLFTVAEIGLSAGRYYSSGEKPSQMWTERMLEVLQNARKPRGQVELVIVDAIEKLVVAAAN